MSEGWGRPWGPGGGGGSHAVASWVWIEVVIGTTLGVWSVCLCVCGCLAVSVCWNAKTGSRVTSLPPPPPLLLLEAVQFVQFRRVACVLGDLLFDLSAPSRACSRSDRGYHWRCFDFLDSIPARGLRALKGRCCVSEFVR